jgi:hypothetical protein
MPLVEHITRFGRPIGHAPSYKPARFRKVKATVPMEHRQQNSLSSSLSCVRIALASFPGNPALTDSCLILP